MVRPWSQVGLQPLWSLGTLAWRYVGHFLSLFNQAPSFLTSSCKMGLAEGCLEMPAPRLVAVTKLIAWLPDKRVTSSFSLKLVGKRNIPVLACQESSQEWWRQSTGLPFLVPGHTDSLLQPRVCVSPPWPSLSLFLCGPVFAVGGSSVLVKM